jgi:hypothetical protein
MSEKKRNYAEEYKNYHGTKEQIENRSQRNKARRAMEADGKVAKGDGKDVNHKKAIANGGSNSKRNLEAVPKSENRGWRKGKSGYNPS